MEPSMEDLVKSPSYEDTIRMEEKKDEELEGFGKTVMDEIMGYADEDGDISPVPEVAATVPLTDDPTLPGLTFRFWLLASFFTILAAAAGQFYFFRSATITLSLFFVQLLSYPMGVTLAKIVPKVRVFGMELNPGAFNVKEHTLITVCASTSLQVAYGIDILSTQQLFYGQNIGPVASILLLWTTQCIGYGLAGIMRRWLVYPSAMWWPTNLPYVSLLTTFHGATGQVLTAKRLRMFKWVFCGILAYTFLPSFIAPALTSIALICLLGGGPQGTISPLLANIGSGYIGGGAFSIAFDWNYIGVTAPMYTPFWANMNLFVANIAYSWLVTPLFAVTGLWANDMAPNATTIPPYSIDPFDIFGNTYNTSRILTPEHEFIQSAYDAYSPLRLSPFWAVTYGCSFAALTSTLTHVYLHNGKDIWESFRQSRLEDHPDPHVKAMRRYPEVPEWWYMTLFFIMLALSILTVEVWNEALQLRWWGILFAVGLAILFLLPVGIIQAVSNQQIGLNVLTEFIIGLVLPGQPIANIVFKTYGYQAMSQALSLVQDLKFGLYMKIPPKQMFWAQLYGTILGAVTNYLVLQALIAGVPDITRGAEGLKVSDPQWTPRSPKIFFTASVIWGLIAPMRTFGPTSIYYPLLLFFLIGAVIPIPTYYLGKAYPKSFIKYIHWPILFVSIGLTGQNGANIIFSGLVVSIISQYWLLRYRTNWFNKYNYTVSAALDSGAMFTTIIVYLCFTLPKINGTGTFPIWALNPDPNAWESPEYCM